LMGLILILSSASAYFVDRFGILIDKTMIRNVFATNATESLELVSSGLIFQVVLLGVVPALLLQRWPLKKQSFRQIFAHRALIIMALLVMLGGIAAIFYQPHAALLRNHREVRHMLSPVNMLSGVGSLVSEVTRKPLPYEAIAAGVRLGPHRSSIASNPEGMTNRQSRPTLLVLVVGETARAKNFGLNHYARATTPKLQSIPEVVAFDRVVACGTSTAISVPCMFSDLTREEFSIRRARARDNLLDVLEKAGFKVAWFDNNTSCNGVCRDRKEIRADQDTSTALCAANTPCMDGAIFNKVWDQIEEIQQDTVVVIHMLGSHGPGYHLRYPKEYEKFTPVCRETDFSLCGINEIVNAYDNSILYSDYLLAETIENLERRNDSLDSALLFISDHGESLGEKGLFLHAIPYSVAPREQLEVPMVFWMSDGFGDHMNLMPECIRHASHKSLSHDHLFHSILGLVDIELPAKRAELDVFSLCRRS
jgi:lipid A ethanolaminephosphotransferase